MGLKKEQQFKKEFFAMRRRLLAKGCGVFMVYRLIEDAFHPFYGRGFTRKMLGALKIETGDFSA